MDVLVPLMVAVGVAGLCAYGSYRAIKGGFERSQSERLNGYGIFAIVLVVLFLGWTVAYFLT
jgi:hypothetical protein